MPVPPLNFHAVNFFGAWQRTRCHWVPAKGIGWSVQPEQEWDIGTAIKITTSHCLTAALSVLVP